MVHGRLVLIGLMETVCPNAGSWEWELFSAPSLEQLQRAGPPGAQGLLLVRKNKKSLMSSLGLVLFLSTDFSQKVEMDLAQGQLVHLSLQLISLLPLPSTSSISAIIVRSYLQLCILICKAPSHE